MILIFWQKRMGQALEVCPTFFGSNLWRGLAEILFFIYVFYREIEESFFTLIGRSHDCFPHQAGHPNFDRSTKNQTRTFQFVSCTNFPAIPFDRKTAICQRPESSEPLKRFSIKSAEWLDPSLKDWSVGYCALYWYWVDSRAGQKPGSSCLPLSYCCWSLPWRLGRSVFAPSPEPNKPLANVSNESSTMLRPLPLTEPRQN